MTHNTFSLINQFSIAFFTLPPSDIFFSCTEGYKRPPNETDIEIGFVSGEDVTSNVTYIQELHRYEANDWKDLSLKDIMTDKEKLVATWLLK